MDYGRQDGGHMEGLYQVQADWSKWTSDLNGFTEIPSKMGFT